ncbi:alpha-glucosidase domain-containing protein [Zunongwangia sp. SCSIO 43204]|uniref:alpha-glucosidase domain-containing protein n=1 Tax=Zunongwangia sp. SCSIO 43204 TaxID=2779359 RepID=UPI001CAA1022|nr:alpha-glucosidase domain-containing protein [Zunongwangia sp. SCSIO 43204]
MKNLYLKSQDWSFFFILLFSGSVLVNAQSNSFKSIDSKGNTLTIETSINNLKIEFCTPSILRIRSSKTKDFKANEPYMVTRYNWDKVDFKKDENSAKISYKTSKIKLEIQKSPFKLSIFDLQGNLLSEDAVNQKSSSETITKTSKKLKDNEHFFGFGERMDFLDRRGKSVHLEVGRGIGKPHIIGAYNVLEANYSPVPFFMSTKGYGIFYHTSYPSDWDMGKTDPEIYSFSSEDPEVDYYFIYGPDLPKILDHYTSITGKSPMLPKFAMGLHVGTYSGGTWGHEEETSANYPVSLIEKFRKFQIPVDVLHLDST